MTSLLLLRHGNDLMCFSFAAYLQVTDGNGILSAGYTIGYESKRSVFKLHLFKSGF